MKTPNTEWKWLKKSIKFPHCTGAVDGKHIPIKKSIGSHWLLPIIYDESNRVSELEFRPIGYVADDECKSRRSGSNSVQLAMLRITNTIKKRIEFGATGYVADNEYDQKADRILRPKNRWRICSRWGIAGKVHSSYLFLYIVYNIY